MINRRLIAWTFAACALLLTSAGLAQSRARVATTRRAHARPPTFSMGYANGGALRNGVALRESRSVRFLPGRPHHYGTEELLSLLRRAAERVRQDHGGRLTVGDLSDHDGGPIGHHASHQSGRDADLAFYVTDPRGRPALASDYVSFDGRGLPLAGGALRFDVVRNWALVESLVSDPVVRVEHIFVSNPLRTMLLTHARTRNVSSALISRVQLAMHQPVHALPHTNHFHVRIACPSGDSQCVAGVRTRPRPRRPVLRRQASNRAAGVRATRSPRH